MREVNIRTAVVGSSYHPGASQKLSTLKGGSPVDLVREPNNHYDRNAVKCLSSGVMLGYVPRTDAPAVAKAMDDGLRVEASIRIMAPMLTVTWWLPEPEAAKMKEVEYA